MMSFMAVQSVNVMVTGNMLLGVLFVSGAFANCPESADLFITAPLEVKALSGSCLQIPCNFSAVSKSDKTFDSSRTIFAVWIKSDSNFVHKSGIVIFNSSKTDNIYPMTVTGDLSQKNCTTLFSSLETSYTDSYYFRIENIAYMATASCDRLQINIYDSPQKPRINITGDLKEKESVTITCSAFTPCPHSPPKLTWSLQQDPRNIMEENTNRTLTTKIQKTFTLSDKHDGFNITCSVGYPVNEGTEVKTAEERMTLSVSYAPKDTSVSISPSGWVPAGSLVNLTCSSRANPPVSRFTWFKKGNNGPIRVSEGDVYSFNVIDGVYYCVATNNLGSETSPESHLTINGEASSPPLGAILGGIAGIIALICLVICVLCLTSTHLTAQQNQSQTGEELAVKEPPRKIEENIHYGEIDFSRQRPEPSSASEQNSGQQPDTLYAQVKVSKTAYSSTHLTADAPEDLYTQVMKK